MEARFRMIKDFWPDLTVQVILVLLLLKSQASGFGFNVDHACTVDSHTAVLCVSVMASPVM